ncbi:hypothetical protein POM88_035126 [Heracleum sosnowskyi]|uniref:Uncharacterized protein n=1 Tax=Heracleum sosnowskyi TaxID=360622 RepID=A0AAD8MDT5_9APIA|nr:hypothetical protein POM88_035126 [Heracleum sosnowskyi]
MEDYVKDQSSVSGRSSSKLLRHLLRSTTKSKDVKSPPPVSIASKRAKPPSSVSQSMSVLDLSGKGKSAKPKVDIRRYSPWVLGTITLMGLNEETRNLTKQNWYSADTGEAVVSKPWKYAGKEEHMDREDVKILVKKWWDGKFEYASFRQTEYQHFQTDRLPTSEFKYVRLLTGMERKKTIKKFMFSEVQV